MKREWWPVVSGEEEVAIGGVVIGEVGEEVGDKEVEKKKKVVLEGKDFANALVLVVEVRRRLVSYFCSVLLSTGC